MVEMCRNRQQIASPENTKFNQRVNNYRTIIHSLLKQLPSCQSSVGNFPRVLRTYYCYGFLGKYYLDRR